jgi:uncharacterized sulfatase
MEGGAFLGPKDATPREYVFATGDRVDEVLQCSRMVFNGRYQYIRNFLPHRPRMPRSWYSETTPIRQEIRRLAALGQLSGDEAWLSADMLPTDELYDIQRDPAQMKNLIASQELDDRVAKAHLAQVLRDWMAERLDTGMLPESEIHARCGTRPPYEVFREMDSADYERILDMAWRVGKYLDDNAPLIKGLADADSGVRFWAATGLAVLRDQAAETREALVRTLEDPSPAVRIAAAEALCHVGGEEDGLPVLLQVFREAPDAAKLEAAYALNNVAWRSKQPSEALMATLREAAAREDQQDTMFLNWAVSHMRDTLK